MESILHGGHGVGPVWSRSQTKLEGETGRRIYVEIQKHSGVHKEKTAKSQKAG